jgi:hypothetical protein
METENRRSYMKRILITIITLLSLCTPCYAEYFSDIIVTGPNGAWIDSRAYSSLSAAVTAAGANQRAIHIYTPQTVTNLTIPSTVSLVFGRDGSINNSGTLTIQTKNISAPDRQIFTGAGQINFADGSVVRSAWFQNFESALALTNNDKVTLIVSKPQTLTASFAIGNNVILKWESRESVLTVGAGITISNIHSVEAGSYQIFAGTGTFSFTTNAVLDLSWFTNLRTAITWIGATTVVLESYKASVVDYTDTIPSNILFHIKGGSLSISATKVLTVNGTLYNESTITGSGTLTMVGKLINNGLVEDIVFNSSGTYTGIGVIDTAGAISITGAFDIPNDLYVFIGAGTVTGLDIARSEWWGNVDGSIEKAVASLL